MEDLTKLIQKAQKGDRDAYGQIYNLFYRRIFRYCKFNLPAGRQAGVHQAQDICQETFLKAWKSISHFSHQKGGSFQAYLFRIARNLIIDNSRRKKELPLKEYLDVEEEINLEENLDQKQESQKVKNALLQLKEKDRQIIILRYFEELSTAEVAHAVGKREGATRVRIHRILKDLKVILGNTK